MNDEAERSPDDQAGDPESGDAEEAAAPQDAPEGAEEARDYIERIIDTRVAAVYAETWPEILETVVNRVAAKLQEELRRVDPEAIAERAADMGQERLERSAEIIKGRLHAAAAAGAGGSDGRASDGGGGGDGGGDGGDDGADDVRALGDLPDEPRRAERPAAPRAVSSDGTKEQMVTGVLMGLTRIFEDPGAFLTATIDAYVKVKGARAGTTDDLTLAQELYGRKPWLFDVFGKADPLEDRIPSIMARALDVGLKVGSRASPASRDLGRGLRDLVKGKGTAQRPEPSEERPLPRRHVDLSATPAADETPAAERGSSEPAVAPAAQDPRASQGKLRKLA